MKTNIKDWTILVYANGNNELEPEMWQSKLDLEKVGSDSNINIVMEIGRESKELVKLIRPYYVLPSEEEVWTGVRRYYISKGNSLLIQDLGKINMADHKSLYDFITWGIKNYTAKKYMLIISGHAAAFVAALPDFSQDKPYMMGVPEMCMVINMIKNDIGANIDILVLDICYMNIIEIIYEFGKVEEHTVKNLLTYVRYGPINGMPYSTILETMQQTSSSSSTEIMIKNIINATHLDLVAVQIDYINLKRIKELISEMSYSILNENSQSKISTHQIINNFLYDNKNKKLQKILDSLILHSKIIGSTNNRLIEIVTKELYKVDTTEVFFPYYYKLDFSRNNYWTNLLSGKALTEIITIPSSPPAIFNIVPEGFRNIIFAMNPTLKEEAADDIVDKVYNYKNWCK